MKIYGMNVEKYIGTIVEGSNMDFTYEDSTLTRHILYGVENDKKYQIILEIENGICGSGWTTASYGILKKEEIETFPGMQFRSVNPTLEISLETKFDFGEELIENDFFNFSEVGGDEYYPCGGYHINMDMFKSNERGVQEISEIKRKVWLFKGNSGSGKSFLAFNSGLKTYETDFSKELPDTIIEDIIVIGNKYTFNENEIKDKIFDKENTEIISVNFEG